MPRNSSPSGDWDQPGVLMLKSTSLQRAELLDASPWANEFEWDRLQRIARPLALYSASADTVLFEEGETRGFVCIILEGSICIDKRDQDGTVKHLADAGRGQTLGEMSLIDGYPRSATATTKEDCSFLVMTQAGFSVFRASDPDLAFDWVLRVARLISHRLRLTSATLVDMPDC